MKKQLIVLVGLMSIAALASAEPQEPREPGRRGRPIGLGPWDLAQELGLSEAQVAELKTLRLEQRRAAIRRNADSQLARLGLQELLQAKAPDEKAIQARVKELTDLHGSQLRARVDAELALRRILTPEQRAALERLRAERARGEGFDRPRGPRDRPGRVRPPGPPPGRDGEPGEPNGLTGSKPR